MAGRDAADRRAYSRMACTVRAALEWQGESFPSELLDLSFSGVRINTGAAPPLASQVSVVLKVNLGGREVSLRCPGRVVRADHRGLGVHFDPLDSVALALLRDVVAAHCPDPQVVAKEYRRLVRPPPGA